MSKNMRKKKSASFVMDEKRFFAYSFVGYTCLKVNQVPCSLESLRPSSIRFLRLLRSIPFAFFQLKLKFLCLAQRNKSFLLKIYIGALYTILPINSKKENRKEKSIAVHRLLNSYIFATIKIKNQVGVEIKWPMSICF
jgi:hypothetical protein